MWPRLLRWEIHARLRAGLKAAATYEQSDQIDGWINAKLRVYVPPFNTRPNVAVGSLFRPAGRERAGGVSGEKMAKNKFSPVNRTAFKRAMNE
jgi:hypothetical protein